MTVTKLTPFLRQLLFKSDTTELIQEAIALAEEHLYYEALGVGIPDRFAEFYRPDERIGNKTYGVVDWDSWIGYHRFDRCLRLIRIKHANKEV